MDKTRDFRSGDRVVVKNGTNRLDLAHEGHTGRFVEYSHPRRYACIHLDAEFGRTRVLIHPDNVELLAAAPETEQIPDPKASPAGILISTLHDLCRYFETDEPDELGSGVSKLTGCSASISVQLPDGSWRRGMAGVRRILGFRLVSVVEGSGAEVECDAVMLPCSAADIDASVASLKRKAAAAKDAMDRKRIDPDRP